MTNGDHESKATTNGDHESKAMTNGDHELSDAKEGETCDGFNERTGKPFPKCESGLTCERTSDVCIPGSCNTCVKKDEDVAEAEASTSSDSEDICTDDEKCGYVCPNYECQAEGSYFNMNACMCFYEDQCEMECPHGETLDPTEYC